MAFQLCQSHKKPPSLSPSSCSPVCCLGTEPWQKNIISFNSRTPCLLLLFHIYSFFSPQIVSPFQSSHLCWSFPVGCFRVITISSPLLSFLPPFLSLSSHHVHAALGSFLPQGRRAHVGKRDRQKEGEGKRERKRLPSLEVAAPATAVTE